MFENTVELLLSGRPRGDGKWPLSKGLSQTSLRRGTNSLYLETHAFNVEDNCCTY